MMTLYYTLQGEYFAKIDVKHKVCVIVISIVSILRQWISSKDRILQKVLTVLQAALVVH